MSLQLASRPIALRPSITVTDSTQGSQGLQSRRRKDTDYIFVDLGRARRREIEDW